MYQYLSGEQVNTFNDQEESRTTARGLGIFYSYYLLFSNLSSHCGGEIPPGEVQKMETEIPVIAQFFGVLIVLVVAVYYASR